jgi:hypothetical protein
MRRVISSHTSFSNTPESDQQPKVWCNVEVAIAGGTETVRVFASDPLGAMDEVKSMSDAHYATLQRVPPAKAT